MEEDLQALRFKVRYLNCVDDTLKAPNEVWFHQDDNTFYYLKRYGDDVEGEVVIAVKVKDQAFVDYDVIKDDSDRVNSLRYGVLVYRQPLEK